VPALEIVVEFEFDARRSSKEEGVRKRKEFERGRSSKKDRFEGGGFKGGRRGLWLSEEEEVGGEVGGAVRCQLLKSLKR
jgi:hypothetical protein